MRVPGTQIGSGDRVHGGGDCVVEEVSCVGGLSSDAVLELGPNLLDGVPLGRVRRQKENCRARILDGLASELVAMSGKVVHDDAIARPQLRHELMNDEGSEDFGGG